MEQMRPQQLAEWLADDNRKKPVMLDVRQPWEFALCHLPGSLHIPMHLVPLRSNELKRDEAIVVICHHGWRSKQVAMFLEQQGFTSIINLEGGVAGWADQVDADFPRY
ncbi:MAG: rhodanese-like domain-containing protein [Azonexus sp.]|jgi:rhodanese-related sulfurtransferase